MEDLGEVNIEATTYILRYKMEVSKLGVPLLMVNGNFRNLNSLTVEELETFIPFMTGCSLERGGAALVKGVPEWWVRTIQYKFPLKKPKGLSDMGYRRHLQSIVCKCYCYHDAHFLLSFSSKFSQYPQSIFLKSNEDNTTSVFCIENVAEIFTFDNVNKEYDSKTKGKPNWRSLMPAQTNKPNPQVIGDIYLCENCDVEFYSQMDMQKHEKECYGTTLDDLSDDIQIITHIKPTVNPPTDKNGFLDYFGLLSKSLQQQKLYFPQKTAETEAPVKRWVILNMCLHKNRRIEFSSVLGRKMLEHRVRRDVMTRLEKTILSVESFCDNGRRSAAEGREPLKPRITYRNPRKKTWTHSYCFTKKQRMEKLKTLRTGLDERSRTLLKQCKRLRIPVQRLILPPEADFFVVSS